MSSKSVKLFNLEERKTDTGLITDVDIYQWKNTLLDHLRREPEFKEHVLDGRQKELRIEGLKMLRRTTEMQERKQIK